MLEATISQISFTVAGAITTTSGAAVPAAAAAVTAAATWALCRFAAARTAAQPVACDPGAEATIIGAVATDPTRYRLAAALNPEDFVIGAHARIWGTLQDLAVPANGAYEREEAKKAGVPARKLDLDATALAGELASRLDPEAAEALATIAADFETPDDKTFLSAGQRLTAATHDRDELNGGSVIVETGDDTVPLARLLVPASTGRVVASAAIASAAVFTTATLTGGTVLGAAAAMSLVWGLLVLSLVDIDTFYVDVRTLAATAVAAWGFTIWDAAHEGEMHRIAGGLGAFVALGVGVEALAWVHRKIRGIDGFGFGDTMLMGLTVGVPSALSGSIAVGLWSIVVAGIIAIGSRVALMATGRASAREPFAFGPFLAVGWVPAWALAAAAGLGGL